MATNIPPHNLDELVEACHALIADPDMSDDALVNLDEKRLEQAMELLQKIAKKRQVILFSCRK